MGAWIQMSELLTNWSTTVVAPRMRSADRSKVIRGFGGGAVAPPTAGGYGGESYRKEIEKGPWDDTRGPFSIGALFGET